MENEILQKFLKSGLLDIGEDDKRYEALVKASEELIGALSSNKSSVINHTLVALDTDIPLEEPILEEVEELIEKYWKTMRNRFSDRPRSILQGIILEALHTVGHQDPEVAAIIWLTGSSFLPYAGSGHQADICREVIDVMGRLAEEAAVEAWATMPREYNVPQLPTLEIDLAISEWACIDEEKLTSYLATASGPQSQGKTKVPSDIKPNSNWPNQGANWSHQFAPKAAKGIATVIDEANNSLATSLADSIEKLHESINQRLATFQSELLKIVRGVAQSPIVTARRSQLLWWKETLYSPTLRKSYRSCSPVMAVLTMAFDLQKQVPAVYPASVDYLLRETVRDLLASSEEDVEEKISLTAFLDEVAEGKNRAILKKFLPKMEQKACRVPLMTYIQEIVYGADRSNDDISTRIGIPGQQEISWAELSVYCFRDLQAHKLVEG